MTTTAQERPLPKWYEYPHVNWFGYPPQWRELSADPQVQAKVRAAGLACLEAGLVDPEVGRAASTYGPDDPEALYRVMKLLPVFTDPATPTPVRDVLAEMVEELAAWRCEWPYQFPRAVAALRPDLQRRADQLTDRLEQAAAAEQARRAAAGERPGWGVQGLFYGNLGPHTSGGGPFDRQMGEVVSIVWLHQMETLLAHLGGRARAAMPELVAELEALMFDVAGVLGYPLPRPEPDEWAAEVLGSPNQQFLARVRAELRQSLREANERRDAQGEHDGSADPDVPVDEGEDGRAG